MLRIIKALGWALLALVLLIGLAVVSPRWAEPVIGPLRSGLVQAATILVSRSLDGTLRIGALHGSLLRDPTLRDISLRDAQGVLVARIEELRLRYSLQGLLKGRLRVDAIEISQPDLNLVQEADGRLNLVRVLSPEPSPPQDTLFPLAISLEKLTLKGGHIDLALPAVPGTRQVDGVSLQLRGEIDRQGVRFELQKLTAHTKPSDVVLTTVRGRFSLTAEAIHFDDWLLQTASSLITLSATVPTNTPMANLALALRPLDVSEIGRILGEPAVHGLIQGQIDSKSVGKILEVNGHLGVGDGALELEAQIDTNNKPHYRGALAIRKLDLADLIDRAALQSDLNVRCQLEGAGFLPADRQGILQVAIARSHVGKIAIQPSEIRLTGRAERLEVQAFALKTSLLNATVGGELDLAGRSNLDYQLSANLTDARELIGAQALEGIMRLDGRVRGTWPNLTALGAIEGRSLIYDDNRLDKLELAYEGTDLGRAPRAKARLQARKARIGALDIQEITAETTYAYQNAQHQLRFGVHTDQSPRFHASVKGLLTANDQGQQLTISEFQARVEDHAWQAAMPLQASFSPKAIRLKSFRLYHDNESIEMAGALLNQDLEDVRLRATNIDLNFFGRVLSLPPIVAGYANWQADLTGSVADPALTSTLTWWSTAAKELPFERTNLLVSYASEELAIKLSAIQEARQTVALESSLPLDLALVAKQFDQRLLDKPFGIYLDLQQPNLAFLPRALPDMPHLSGSLEGTLAITGTYNQFAIKSNLQLRQFGIEETASAIDAPVRLTADVITAPSVTALREAVATDQVTVVVPRLVLQVPSLTGQLKDQESVARLSLREVLAEVHAQWGADGLRSESTKLQFHADIENFPPIDFLLAARLEPETFTLDRLQLKTPASALMGAGKFHGGKIRFSVDIPLLRLGEFAGLVLANLPSDVTGKLDLTGTLEDPKLTARLHYAGARIDADASARLRDKRQPYRASVRVDKLYLAKFGPDLEGQLQARLQVQGSGLAGELRKAEVSMDIQSRGFTLAPGLSAQLRSRVIGPTIRVDALNIKSEPVDITAQGSFSTAQETDLRYTLLINDLESLGKRLGVDLQAKGDLIGKVSGKFDALQTQNKLQLNDWRYGGWQSKRLRATIDGSKLTSTPDAALQVEITGLEGPGVSPSSLRLQGHFGSTNGDFSLSVTEGPYARSKVSGVFNAGPQLEVQIDPLLFQTEQWAWNNVEPIELVYDAKGALILRSLELKNVTQQISARGSLSAQGAVAADVRIHDLQIKPIADTFVPALPIPDGQLSLELALGGTFKQPQVAGTLQVLAMQWAAQRLGDVRAVIASSGSVVRGHAKWVDEGKELLSFEGSLNTDKAKAIRGYLRVPGFDLARLQPLSPDILQSAGRLRLDLQVGGTLHQPRADGVLELQDGRLQLAATGEPYTDLQTRVVFRGNRIDVERLQVGSRTGRAHLKGWLEADGLMVEQVNLTLDANEFTAIRTQGVEAVVTSDIALRGSQHAMMASGKVTVSKARIRYENLPTSGPADVQPWELTVEGVYGAGPETATFAAAEAAVPSNAEPLSFLRADIQLDMPRNGWVQGTGTAVELGGRLQINKELHRPFVLAGDVETLRGFATILGRKFTIDKGVVTFTGSEDINPILDVTTSYNISDYTIYVYVTGESKKPDIKYGSDPELDQGDILSLLVFGKTSDRLTSSEQSTLGSKAAQFAGGLAAGMLEQTVGKALGLDTIAIEVGDQGSASTVGAGRYLTQDIYVEYERRLRDPRKGNRGGNAVTVEYSISRGIKVKGTGSDFGETAIDFVWSHDY